MRIVVGLDPLTTCNFLKTYRGYQNVQYPFSPGAFILEVGFALSPSLTKIFPSPALPGPFFQTFISSQNPPTLVSAIKETKFCEIFYE